MSGQKSPVSKQPHAAATIAERYREALNLLQSGDVHTARSLLEDIVAERPEFAGAWIDLALATQRCGDTPAALEHLAYIRQRFPLPAVLARQVELWQHDWEAPHAVATAQDTWRGEISFDLGYNNNVNGGLSQGQITLTIPGGISTLPLAPNYRPRGDVYGQMGIHAWRRWQFDGGSIFPLLQIRNRQMLHENDSSQFDAQVGALYQTPPDAHGAAWQAGVLLQQNRLGGEALMQARRIILQRLHPIESCRLTWGGELEHRQFSGLPFDGTLTWLDAGLACKTAPDTQLAASARAGREHALSAQRPGGDNRQLEITLQGSHVLPWGSTLDLRWQHAKSRDDEGYSPLLANNARRRTSRNLINATLRHTLSAEWEARLSFEFQQQRSNLDIFSQDARQISVGVSRAF